VELVTTTTSLRTMNLKHSNSSRKSQRTTKGKHLSRKPGQAETTAEWHPQKSLNKTSQSKK